MLQTCRICLRTNPSVISNIVDYTEIIRKIAQIEVILDDSYPSKVCSECINDLLNADLLRDMLLECNSNRLEKLQPVPEDTPLQLYYPEDTPLQLDYLEDNVVKQEIFSHDDELKVDNVIEEPDPDSDLDMKEEYLIEALEEEEKDESLGIDEPKPLPYQCNHCLADFNSPVVLSRHLQSVHNDNIFKPKKQTGNTTVQKRINRRVNIYHCHRCKEDVTNLSVHVRKFHADLPPEFKCQYCGAIYEKISTLYTHTYNLHTNKSSAVCDECGDVFNRKCRLEEHKRAKHLGLKIFVCAICTARFARKNNLRAHIRSHTGEKPYKCEFCTKAYNHFSDWKTHHLSHTGNWSYFCPTCNKGFYKPSALKTHMKSH